MSEKLHHSGLYRSSNQKIVKGVISGLTHKLFFGANFHIYFAHLLRIVALIFSPAIWIFYAVFAYLLKPQPTIDDGSDLTTEIPSWFEKLTTATPGSWQEKMNAWNLKGTPFDNAEYQAIRDKNTSPLMKSMGGFMDTLKKEGERQLNQKNGSASAGGGVYASFEKANAEAAQQRASSTNVIPQPTNSSSTYPQPYVVNGAIVTKFDPQTGFFNYKSKCEACNKVSANNESGRTSPSTKAHPYFYTCPHCMHLTQSEVNW